jgi:hypothetical protein
MIKEKLQIFAIRGISPKSHFCATQKKLIKTKPFTAIPREETLRVGGASKKPSFSVVYLIDDHKNLSGCEE